MNRITPSVLLPAAAAALLWAAPADAQTAIRAGQPVRGELTASDPKLSDDSHYDLYAYRGTAGEQVVVTMRSTAFDAIIAGGVMNGRELAVQGFDDDGGGGTDSRMEITVPASGTLVIRANSLRAGETGAYTVQVERGQQAGGGGGGGGGGRAQGATIRAGQTVQGQLSGSDPKLGDDSHYDLYTYQGRPGEEIEITLRSDDFDAYLGGGGTPDAALSGGDTDDDGAGGTHSRLRVSVGSNGQYVIRANSLRGGVTGGYSLAVRSAGDGGNANSGGGGGNFPTVRVGQTVSGRLDASDPKLNDGSHFDVLTYNGSPGEEIVITLSSNDFDPYMTLARMFGGELEEVAKDDDSGPGNNAQVRARLDRSGSYMIVANSFGADETGSYTVTVQRGADVATGEARGAAAGMVSVQAGQPVRGRLDRSDRMLSDSSFADMYVYSGSPGERIQITLRSTDFDSYLSVGTTDGEDLETIDQDDDGGGGTDAQVVVEVDRAGLYAIQANSYAKGQTGTYTLTVERVAAQAAETGRGGGQASASSLQGKWVAGYPAVQSPQFRTMRDQMQGAGRMEAVTAQLADFPLPRNVPLQFGECGFVNAFYSPAEGSVTFCYEMFPYLNQALGAQAQGSDLTEAVDGAFLFIMMHEVGHALTHQLDLPITGREEDAADQLAALILLRDGDKGASAAIAGVAALQSGGTDFDDSDFADEHSLGPQRLYNVICWIYGSDPAKYQGWVTNGLLPEARAVRCPAEYEQMSKAWTRLLGAHYGN